MNQFFPRQIFAGLVLLIFCLSIAFAGTPTENKTSGLARTGSSYSRVIKDDVNHLSSDASKILSKITPDKNSALEKRFQQEKQISGNPFGIMFYKPTYILPFYYTGSPYDDIYRGNTPGGQDLKPEEFKAQFSIKLPVWSGVLGQDSSLNIAYTQLLYWQVYAKSQYFRETNYEPELYFSKKIVPNWWVNVGVDHESNGRGGDLERSWNRVIASVMFSNTNWMVTLRPWVVIFRNESSNLHNKDISDYLGSGDMVVSYKIGPNVFSLMMRNNIESGFSHGANEFDYSLQIHGPLRVYLQLFSGYGQSLIEYDHYTNAIGVGIALNDWI